LILSEVRDTVAHRTTVSTARPEVTVVSSCVLETPLDMDSAVPAVVAAYRFDCSVAVIKGWAARKRIESVGTDKRWGRLYRWRDLLAAEKATREAPNPNRRPVAEG
jgi:hypothetical protein